MDLIERYLQAVKFWLPNEQKDDIIAELSADIHDRIDEQELALGRNLTAGELEAMVKQMGKPFVVASRYLPPRYLIGPQLYPFYIFALKIMGAIYLSIWIVMALTTDQAWRVSSAASVALIAVTIVFSALDGIALNNWEPSRLPPVRDHLFIPRSSSVMEIAANMVILACYGGIQSSSITDFFHLILGRSWHWFLWGFVAVAIANIALAAINLTRPYWTQTRATIRLLTDLLGAALFCAVLRSNVATTPKIIAIWMEKCFVWAIVVMVIIVAFDARRITRLRSKTRPLTQAPAH